MKIYHVSDTHGGHELLRIPKDIDVMIHSGDASNYMNPLKNFTEMTSFIDWYEKVDIKNKIYVAGNHDTSVYQKMITKEQFEKAGIIYLELNSVVIDGVKFFGNPFTPKYGEWAYMLEGDYIKNIYELIDNDVDVLITHGPPKGILDLSYDVYDRLEFCGCPELRKYLYHHKNIKSVLFGHIHSYKDIDNTGVRILRDVTYSNASVVTDRQFNKGLSSNGNILTI